MCQYTDRCPVRHHRPGTKCPYTRHGRSRTTSARSRSGRYRTPSIPAMGSTRNIQPEPPIRKAVPKRPYQHYQEQRPIRRKQNRQVLLEGATGAAAEAAVTYLFKPDGVYEVVADRLLNSTKLHRRFGRARGHWLCVVLNNAAQACETGTYIDLVARGTEQGLREAYGMPRVVAKVLTQCIATSAKLLLAPTVFGPTNFPTALRGLIALVCPNLDRCPTRADVCTTLFGPLVADSLRAAVGGDSPGPQSRPASS
jgi:hypothetical protein